MYIPGDGGVCGSNNEMADGRKRSEGTELHGGKPRFSARIRNGTTTWDGGFELRNREKLPDRRTEYARTAPNVRYAQPYVRKRVGHDSNNFGLYTKRRRQEM